MRAPLMTLWEMGEFGQRVKGRAPPGEEKGYLRLYATAGFGVREGEE